MFLRLASVAAIVFSTSVAIAAPTVTGDTISWPDDGWYQVLDERDYSEVCGGTSTCVVSPGSYSVINHTTGMRYNGIVVEHDIASPIVVTGNSITWPDDGWYQVLDERDYSEVCGGTPTCVVSPGSYSVINHTSGMRYDGIVVQQDSTDPYNVSGDTINWLDDGWYQLLDELDYSEVCGGTGSCVVSPGSYALINHTTGMRWDNIIVGEHNATTTRVNFDITVPAYSSNSLKVVLTWGGIDISAMWVNDETWTAAADFPIDTQHVLTVTFSDRNGAIALGTYEQDFKTGTDASESFLISASQFDTQRWDSDSDGVSNLDELIAGSDPEGDSTLLPVQASLELVQDKTFHIAWQPTAGAQYYRILENPDGVSGFEDISGELGANATNFDHRVALHSRVNAKYMVQSCNDQGCVDSEQVAVTGTLDNAIGYVKASNTGRADWFGSAVSLSADGNTMAVGAYAEGSSATGINGIEENDSAYGSGAVYLFVRSGGLWQQQAYLKASNTDREDFFGFSVSLSADGDMLAVGAPYENSVATGVNGDQTDNSGSDNGAAYVFVRNGEQWLQETYIKGSHTGNSDLFGQAVSLSADGNTLAVGAAKEDSAATGINGDGDDNSATNSGAVYVFIQRERQWQQQAYLKASNTGRFDEFGSAVSLSADGNTLAIGARGEESANADQNDNSADNSGAAYVFVRSDDLWQQQAYIKASNTENEDLFGSAVSLSADGNTLAVGANREDSAASGINGDQRNNTSDDSGAAYVFVRIGGSWQQQAYIKAINTNGGDWFGRALSLSANGNMLAVGARHESSAATGINGDEWDNSFSRAGAAYLFFRSNGLWQQQAYVKASNPIVRGSFGESVVLSADANTLAVGASGDKSAATGINGNQTDISAPGSGAVYLY